MNVGVVGENMDKPVWIGAIWFLLGTGIFSIIFISGKLFADHISIFQLLFFRYLAGFLVICLLAIVRKQSVRSPKPATHFLRTLFGMGGAFSIIYASANMPVADATGLSLMEGVLTLVLGVMFFKDQLRRQQVFGIIACLFGAVFMIREQGFTGGQGWSYWLPASIALGSAVLLACEGVLLKIVAMRENALTVLFHVNGFALLLMSIPAFLTWQPADLTIALLVSLLGIFAIIAQYCNILGYRIAPLYLAGGINYTWIIFASFWGMVFFDEFLSFYGFLGALGILCGGIMLVRKKPNSK